MSIKRLYVRCADVGIYRCDIHRGLCLIVSPKSPFGKGGFRGNVDVNGCINALAFLYQQRGLHNGRLPQNCIDQVRYQEGVVMQFFAMTVLIYGD